MARYCTCNIVPLDRSCQEPGHDPGLDLLPCCPETSVLSAQDLGLSLGAGRETWDGSMQTRGASSAVCCARHRVSLYCIAYVLLLCKTPP